MLHVNAAPPGAPVLAGRLKVARTGPNKRPVLRLVYWSPSEHVTRETTDLPDEYRLGGLVPVELSVPLAEFRVLPVTTDPAFDGESRRIIAGHLEALRGWRSEMAIAGRIAGPPMFAPPPPDVIRHAWVAP